MDIGESSALQNSNPFEIGESGALSLKEYFESLLKVNIDNLEQYYEIYAISNSCRGGKIGTVFCPS